MNRTGKLRGVLLVALSAACFGLMPIFAKMAYAAGTSPYTLLFLRFLVAAALMFPLLFWRKVPLPSKQEMLTLFLLGAVGYVSHSFCYFNALLHASSSVVALLLYTYPALVMLGSALCLKEKITLQNVICLCFALAGAFVIVGAEWNASPKGIILAVLTAIFYSTYILVSSRIVKAGMGLPSSAFIMLGAAAVYGAMNWSSGFNPPTQWSGLMAIGMIALISTVLAFWAFFTGMEKTGPTTAALVSILEPVVTVFSSVIILSEKITANIMVGGCLVLISLLVTVISVQEPRIRNSCHGFAQAVDKKYRI